MEATLILSRKDGSIISAEGLLSDDRGGDQAQRDTWTTQGRLGSETTTKAIDEAKSPKKSQDHEDSQKSPMQSIANAVYDFVNAASSLSSSLEFVVAQRSARTDFARNYRGEDYTPGGQAKERQQAMDEYVTADGVQLLRLRTRKYEIIIFPDDKFLCCVVRITTVTALPTGNGRPGGGVAGRQI